MQIGDPSLESPTCPQLSDWGSSQSQHRLGSHRAGLRDRGGEAVGSQWGPAGYYSCHPLSPHVSRCETGP